VVRVKVIMQDKISYCSTNSMCFLSEPFSGVNVNAPGRVTPIEHCLQTPGRDDVTSHEHMFWALCSRISLRACTSLGKWRLLDV